MTATNHPGRRKLLHRAAMADDLTSERREYLVGLGLRHTDRETAYQVLAEYRSLTQQRQFAAADQLLTDLLDNDVKEETR